MTPLTEAFESLASRRVVLFGGKGGVGKTTVATAAAIHFAESRPAILFTTDPASNLPDLFRQPPTGNRQLTVESLDSDALYRRFLSTHLESFLEVGDRGTYLDREELRRLFDLSLPGVDELMAWMHIGELAEEHPEAIVVVDTAPTGHTLRMLSSSDHFHQLALALDAMQEKHRALVRQFTRRDVKDAVDAFIEEFDARARQRRELLTDAARTAFVPVTLSEPLVVTQTLRVIDEVADAGAIDVPFVILNRADPECAPERDAEARGRLERYRVIDAVRACVPLDDVDKIRLWTAGELPVSSAAAPAAASAPRLKAATTVATLHTIFLAGKGGVGKTSCAASIALQLALRNPDKQYVAISVDPAHSLRDVFAGEAPPPNLVIETIDTREKWRRFRDRFGERIARAVDSLTPGGMSLAHDAEAMQRLIEIAPPGADELFAITRLADLTSDAAIAAVIVDTAPTGHFLRLLDLPRTGGEWVREFMRLLLRYRELIPSASIGEELVRASRALKQVEEVLRRDSTAVVVVTRPERVVVAETMRLVSDLRGRGIRVGEVIANYVTPVSDCACDRAMRVHELAALGDFDDAVVIERRDAPPTTLRELASLVPL